MEWDIEAVSYEELQAKIFECLANEEILFLCADIEEIEASVVLRGVVEAIESNCEPSFRFDRMIRLRTKQIQRENQREIALALKLDSSIMAVFDEYDEEDDFNGVLAREPIPLVAKEINRILKDSRFLLIVYEYYDDYNFESNTSLPALGVPITKWSGHKILLTVRGRYLSSIFGNLRFFDQSRVTLSMKPMDLDTALDCAYKQASEIADHVNKHRGKSILTPTIIFRCLWYQLVMDYFRNRSDIQHVKYCACEGIIEKDAAREIQNMLPQKVFTEIIRKPIRSLIWDALMLDSNRRWTRPELLPPKTLVLESSTLMFVLPPDAECYHSILIKTDLFHHWDKLQWGLLHKISSLFIGCPAEARLATLDNFFRQFTNLRVLHLFHCIISSMPRSFLGLRSLRFLSLESCVHAKNNNPLNELQSPTVHSPTVVAEGEEECLGSLLILDLFNNNFDSLTSEAFKLMPNLEEINVVKSTSHIHLEAPQGLDNLRKLQLIKAGLENVHDGFFRHTKKLEVLNFSNNSHTKYVPSLSRATRLKELVLDGCKGLEILDLNLPTSLELISLKGCSSLKIREFVLPPLPNLRTFSHTESQITTLSLQGCSMLEEINLEYLSGLEVLDLSSTALKWLQLDSMQIPELKQLVLLGCKKLKRINWDGLRLPLVGLLVDNCGSTREDGCLKSFQTQKELHIGEDCDNIRFFEVHIVVRDARFLRSLITAFSNLLEVNIHIHIHISSSAASSINNSTTRMISPSKEASPVAFDSCRYAHYYTVIKKRHASNELPSPSPPLARHIEIDGDSRFPFEIKELMRLAKSLSVHDNVSITTIERPMRYLKQCRVERCRNMDTIFTPKEENDNALECLEIIWAYNLLRLNFVCKEGINLGPESFSKLQSINLEFCPRLKFVFPSNLELISLETINIRHCSDLRAVFLDRSNGDGGGRSPKLLPKLSSICFQELPRLRYICKSNICCPVLQQLKFRGCWSLRNFPIFNPSDNSQAKALKISCEKDWWENLEWDGLEVSHHHSLFNPLHSPYYKKSLKARYL